MSHQDTFQLDQFNCFKHLLDKKKTSHEKLRQATKKEITK